MPIRIAVTVLLLHFTQTAAAAELVAPYVQTVQDDVELMLDLAGVGPGDYLIDLGSGDGRIVIGAAARGAMGLGVELDSDLVALSQRLARARGVAERAAFIEGDIFAADIADATIVTLYLMPEVNLRLRPKLLSELSPGTRVVSNSFDMGEWIADRHIRARSSGGLHLWIVPAEVAGFWRIEVPGRTLALEVEQSFQRISGTLRDGDTAVELARPVLQGDRITFSAVGATARYAFTGRIDGEHMAGIVHVHDGRQVTAHAWRAGRAVDAP
jgi:hypothetical protein